VEEFAKVLYESKDRLTHYHMQRITQAIVSSGNKLHSPSIKELLTEYIEENMSKKDFPKEIRVNLTRIIEFTQINIGEIKDSL